MLETMLEQTLDEVVNEANSVNSESEAVIAVVEAKRDAEAKVSKLEKELEAVSLRAEAAEKEIAEFKEKLNSKTPDKLKISEERKAQIAAMARKE